MEVISHMCTFMRYYWRRATHAVCSMPFTWSSYQFWSSFLESAILEACSSNPTYDLTWSWRMFNLKTKHVENTKTTSHILCIVDYVISRILFLYSSLGQIQRFRLRDYYFIVDELLSQNNYIQRLLLLSQLLMLGETLALLGLGFIEYLYGVM